MTPAGWVDAVIAFTLLEGVWLWRRGWPPAEWAWNWASGLALMGALRAALADWPLAWVLTGVCAAGALHACDLWWRQARRASSGMRTSQTMP